MARTFTIILNQENKDHSLVKEKSDGVEAGPQSTNPKQLSIPTFLSVEIESWVFKTSSGTCLNVSQIQFLTDIS